MDSDDETPNAKRSQTTSGENKSGKKKSRPSKKAAPKKTQTDLAVEGLVADQDDMLSNGESPYHETQHVMPDTPASMNTADLMTPRSDRGADFPMVTIVLNPWERTGSAASNREAPITPPEEPRKEPPSPTNEEEKQPVQKEKETTSTASVESSSSRESSYANSDSDDDCIVVDDSGAKMPKSTRKCSLFLSKVKSEDVEGNLLNF